MMKVEVLYFQGCPYRAPALERVRAVLSEEGVTAEVAEIEIPEATTTGPIAGSPTIRIDGVDVDQAPDGAGLAGHHCRTYRDGSRVEGMPSVDAIRRSVRGSNRKMNN